MKPYLIDVTLVCMETLEHELARLAVEDCLSKVSFGDILILTDKPEAFEGIPARFHKIKVWYGKAAAVKEFFDAAPLIHTSHSLNVEWDSWIVRPDLWRGDFLEYDYIGAPWWYKDGMNVGNGGFSLTSSALRKYLYDHPDLFPSNSLWGDDLICRKYRPILEAPGFKWAPEEVARQFSFECTPPPAFGFHGVFNFPHVLSGEELNKRLKIILQSEYAKNTASMGVFRSRFPEIHV